MDFFLDENYEEAESRLRNEYNYGEFSDAIRRKLLAKNFPKPDNIYDVLYSNIRQELLAKNQNLFDFDLETQSKSIRDLLLAKNQENDNFDLEKSSNKIRERLIAKNTFIDSLIDQEKIAYNIRKGLLEKNVSNGDFHVNYDQIRADQLAKNNSVETDLNVIFGYIREALLAKNINNNENLFEKINDSIRNQLLAKNKVGLLTDNELENLSKDIRENLLSKNKQVFAEELESEFARLRNHLLSKNQFAQSTLDYEKEFDKIRKDNLSRNAVDSDQESINQLLFSKIREQLLAKNQPMDALEIDSIANSIRTALLAKNNLTDTIDNENKFTAIRQSLLAKNEIDELNNKEYSFELERDRLLAKNKEVDPSELDNISQSIRMGLLAKNKEVNIAELESVFENIRNSLLAKNNSIDPLNNEKLFEEIRKGLIAKNESLNIDDDFDKIFDNIRKQLLSKNESASVQKIEDEFASIRNGLLAKNITFNTEDLDTKFNLIRNSLLSKNTNLLTEPSNYDNERSALLARNKLIENEDIENLFNEIRTSLLAKNSYTKLDVDVINSAVRQKLLASNSQTLLNENYLDDISVSIRNALLSKTPESINIDELFSQIRSGLLAKNSQIPDTDLESISLPIRRTLLSYNSVLLNQTEFNYDAIRNNLLSKNKVESNDYDKEFEEIRKNLLSANNLKTPESNEKLFEEIRNNLLSFNSVKNDLSNSLDSISEQIRLSLLSKNNPPDLSEIDAIGEQIRNNLLSKNSEIKSEDFDSVFTTIRQKLLASNTNLLKTEPNFDAIRNKQLAANASLGGKDLDQVATPIRENLLNKNDDIKNSNLDSIAASNRDNLLSKNQDPSNFDLETSSNPIRENLLSKNTNFATIDLDALGESFRNAILALNNFDLLSETFLEGIGSSIRNTLLAKNVILNSTDVDAIGNAVRDLLLAKNNVDLLDVDFLDTFSQTLRDNLIAQNVTLNSTDLDAIANAIRDNILSYNINININDPDYLTNFSEPIRNDLLAANNVNLIDPNYLDGVADPIRNSLLASNQNLMTVDMESQSAAFRNRLLAKNSEMEDLGQFILLPGGGVYVGASYLDALSVIPRTALTIKNNALIKQTQRALSTYSTGRRDEIDGFNIPEGTMTTNVRRANVELNPYVLDSKYLSEGRPGHDFLQSYQADGFQKYRGHIGQTYAQKFTSTTSKKVIGNNKGTYLNQAPELILKPPFTGPLSNDRTQVSDLMSQTVPSDAITDIFYLNDKKRGLVGVMDKIKTAGRNKTIKLAANYDTQYNKAFVIGKNSNGTLKKSFSKYTIANPYKADRSVQPMTLAITNYALDGGGGDNSKESFARQTMYFPPYLKSFQNSDNANWADTFFLGRPEAIYTYSNSKREGTIEFVVLTDFSQEVDIGNSWGDNTENLPYNFDNKRFSDVLEIMKAKKNGYEGQLERDRDVTNGLIREREMYVDNSLLPKELAEIDRKIQEQNVEHGNMEKSISDLETKIGILESNKGALLFHIINEKEGNVFASTIAEKIEESGNEINAELESTITKLDSMKSQLMFRPAFFSGDKVDFVRRMEFLSQCTRPSRSEISNGFQFINPPVCHIKLGDWFNYDVVINSVSYNYEDVPWTFDKDFNSRVQPMWSNVTIQFNIVSGWYNPDEQNTKDISIPLAGDDGGIYQKHSMDNGKVIV